MRSQGLAELVAFGRLDEAVQLALQHRVSWVGSQLTYDNLDAEAEAFELFFARWLAELPALERLAAADWVAAQYVLGLAHLEHARGTAARLLLEAQRSAADALASSMDAFAALTDGPDAELDETVSDRLHGYAEQLRDMSFEPIYLDELGP